mmetsp:Transcript_58757/g.110065  ORF Transcript_58757/g.110065 Transcript_58757/m.110065 type:complete len:197 (-) Transcript_58757:84-674(-)
MSQAQAHSSPAAELQRQMATAAAQQGARAAADRARTGFFEVQAYISENPASVKVLCFCIGLALMLLSLLGLINPLGIAFQPKETLCNLYNFLFGVIICLCDGKESWVRSCGDLQGKLFQRAFFLATQTGRSFFYLYVGSTTLLLLNGNWFWDMINIVIGSGLCFLALVMLFMRWCGHHCGQGSYGQMASPTAPRQL